MSSEGHKANEHVFENTAVPHTDVEVLDFYKLIENDMIEPKRMRQLLTWCASRALLEKPRPADGASTIEHIAIESGKETYFVKERF
jgi:hypothetical protein